MTAVRRAARLLGRRVGIAALLILASAASARAQSAECDGTEGEREVRSLVFSGNHAFTGRDLALRVSTTSSDFLQRRLHAFGTRRCLDSDALRLDVGRLRVFYQRHGYYSTAVDTTVTANDDGSVRVAFLIEEGQPVLIDTLRISGLDNAVRAVVDTGDITLRRGRPFDRTQLQSSIDTIKGRLRNTGYPRADVAASYTVDTASRRATVGMTVLPGNRARIGEIRVFNEPLPGQESARLGASTVRRLSSVRTGDTYSEREIAEAQRELYQTDLFRNVELRLAPDSLQPAGDSLITLDLRLRENYLRQVDTEIGWSTLDCLKERTRYTDKNFFGGARRLELTAQVSKVGYGTPTRIGDGNLCATTIREDPFSEKLNYFSSVSLRLPTLFGFRASPTFSLYSERRSEYRAFLRTTVVGGEASFTRDVVRGIPLRLGYALEYGRTEAQPALLCALFSRCKAEDRAFITDRNRRLAVASAHVERVRTDDQFIPRAGTVVRLDVRTAMREIGSDSALQFLKGLSDASYYKALGAGVTFAARVRLGTVLGRTLSFRDSTGFVPPEERLYAGGATSVRGFQQNALGDLIYIADAAPRRVAGGGDTVYLELGATPDSQRVNSNVVPVGGNSLIVTNVELRLRSRFFPELLQYTIFADAGDVWQRGTVVGRRTHKASALYLNGLRWTPGVGVRVFTPVGPFQANVGYNPFPRPAGAIYYEALNSETGVAPLYCVSPGNRIPAVPNANGDLEQQGDVACPNSFKPQQKSTFLSRLTFTFSIGPDF